MAGKKMGQITFRFYELPDGNWTVKPAVGQKDVPDPSGSKQNRLRFNKMLFLSGELARYAQQQVNAMNVLIVTKQEVKIIEEQIKAKKLADVDKYQKKLPFEEDTNDTKKNA